jgi:hypothetical protein
MATFVLIPHSLLLFFRVRRILNFNQHHQTLTSASLAEDPAQTKICDKKTLFAWWKGRERGITGETRVFTLMPDEPPLDILRCDGQANPHDVIVPETIES